MLLLAILLVLGVILYVGMSAPIHEPGSRRTGLAPLRTCRPCADAGLQVSPDEQVVLRQT